MTNKTIEQYIGDPEFQEFLNEEFSKTAVHSTVEELAEFAFGNLHEAFKAFEEFKRE